MKLKSPLRLTRPTIRNLVSVEGVSGKCFEFCRLSSATCKFPHRFAENQRKTVSTSTRKRTSTGTVEINSAISIIQSRSSLTSITRMCLKSLPIRQSQSDIGLTQMAFSFASTTMHRFLSIKTMNILDSCAWKRNELCRMIFITRRLTLHIMLELD